MLFSEQLCSTTPLRQAIRDYHRIDEDKAIDFILPEAEIDMRTRSRAWDRARQLVLRIRQEQEGHGGVDALLSEYSLSSAEGVVLMCLAEALLRVPDKATQDSLIRDKLSQGEWAPHLGNSDSMFVNASSWGLLLTGNMVNYADKSKSDQFNLLKKTMGRLGEPVIRRAMNIAMKVMGRQFVMGETIDAALKRAVDKEKIGYAYSYDMLGEGARTQADADRYYAAYETAIHAIGKAANGRGPRLSPGISVKLSAIHPRYEFTHRDRVMAEMPPKLLALCLLAKQYDIGFTVDAEESERLDISLDIIEQVFSDPQLEDWTGFGLAVQAYQKRAIHVIEWLRSLTLTVGRTMMVRLVKGAYWDSEIKMSQQMGVDQYPVFTRKSSTDVSYHACANRLLAYRDTMYPQFATHNAYTASVIIELAGSDRTGFEFQCLHGMGDTLYDSVVSDEGIQCRIYAPVGDHEDLLAYLVRRLLENGANSSFVNAIIDDSKPVEALLEDPVERTQRLSCRPNPAIPMPHALYAPSRVNSRGLDITDMNLMVPLKRGVERFIQQYTHSLDEVPQGAVAVLNPANRNHVVGYHKYDDADSMKEKLKLVSEGFTAWQQRPVEQRAEILNLVADALERHRDELIALCIAEAGKVTQDAIDEIREAVDFCRYYAVEVQRICTDERLLPRGVVLAISPWNFPLAIFLGQVVAALAAGNTVMAKAAEQTALIARRAVEIMYSVGLPEDALQLVVATGLPVGETLLPDDRISAVMFTGSTQTATLIARTLATRSGAQVPLIAETGGQNCMIVDSTALPEQVIDDVVHSGFQSAGQRCSALRVLFVQEEIADTVINMLVGAMKELSIALPNQLHTDVGPVIDQKAWDSLNAHAQKMQTQAKLHYQCDVDKVLTDKGYFFPPTLYEIDNLSVLEKEVFGPVVHVVRFSASELDDVMAQINSLGYGLTMGIHSRIEERANQVAANAKVGNVYINRNMIGAIVGVQPFGGRGLSGTGPKAGGPNYLPRLMLERTTPAEIWYASDNSTVDFGSDDDHYTAVEEWMQGAEKVFPSWRYTSLNDRLSLLRQMLAKLAKEDVSKRYAEDLDFTLASARRQLTLIEQELEKPVQLPGPTGESNKLYLEPRGVLLGYGDSSVTFEYWVLSLVTALATGNTLIAVVSDAYFEEIEAIKGYLVEAGMPAGVLQIARTQHLTQLLSQPQLNAVVVDSHNSHNEFFCAQLAKRDGPILPVITSEYMDKLIIRLMTEKTVSIDTTASGGNTSLMTLVDDD